jgi:hypothetical protein
MENEPNPVSAFRSKPILVTGPHRSGSTWTGRMLAHSPEIGYIHEPFHLKHRRGIFKTELEYWFTYICDENASEYAADLCNCLHFNYNFSEELSDIESPRDALRMMRDSVRFEMFKRLRKRPLVKDPLAVFSAEWMARRFDMDVVVMVRHPAAFASSLKKANWTHPFDHFVRQPWLMRQQLAEHRPEIEEYANTRHDIVDQAILLWNLLYHVIVQYRASHPGWIFVKHEDLAEDPVGEFGKLYDRLGIGFTAAVQRSITAHSSPGPNEENPRQPTLDSKANIRHWKTILTEEEIRRVKEKTRAIAREFYTEEEWTS